MNNILILYGTTEGHTAKIAEHMAGVARSKGHTVQTRNARELPGDFSWESFGAVIIGASVHYQKNQKYIRDLVKSNLDSLQHIPCAFFRSVEPQHNRQDRQKSSSRIFCKRPGGSPKRLGYLQVPFCTLSIVSLKRLFMKKIMKSKGGPTDTSRDYEYTDWGSVTRFVEDFLVSVD